MNKQVILHLGAHKTGTSLIQRYMRDNQVLVNSNKVGFTLRGDTDEIIGWGDTRKIREKSDFLKKSINSSFEEGKKYFFISHENSIGRPFSKSMSGLYPNSPDPLMCLAEVLSDFNVKIIYYTRKQSSFVESYYLQTVHEGSSTLFKDWIKSIDTKSLSWKPVIDNIKYSFSNSKIILKNFDEEIINGQSDFLRKLFKDIDQHFADGDFNGFKYETTRNISVGYKGLEMALRINSIIDTAEERKKVRNFLQWNFNNKQYDRPSLLTAEEAACIDEFYNNENSCLVNQKTGG